MKALKAWTIITLILALASLALVILCIFRPYGFGLWMVTAYEDMTSTFGHTIEGAYNKLSLISIISFAILFIINQILLWTYIAKSKKENSEKEIVKKEEPKKETTDNLTEEEKMILKRIRKEVSKEKKEKAKRIGKKVVRVVVEEVTEIQPEESVTTKTPVAKSGNDKLASFLDSFRK